MIKFLTLGSFPVYWGYGATVQYKNIARGLLKHGCECVHVCDYPNGASKELSEADREFFDQIKLIEVYPQNCRFANNRFLRRIQRIFFNILLLPKFIKAIYESKCDVIIFFGCYPFLSLLVRLFTKIPLYGLRGEYPLYGQRIRWYNLHSYLVERIAGYRWFDGMFVMTDNLRRYYSKISSSTCRFMVMPAIVDVNKFDCIPKDQNDSDYITYCGDFGGNKDGVNNLLQAFIMVAAKCPDIKLKLIGSTTEQKTLDQLIAMSQNAGLADRVVFTGRLPNDDVVRHLVHSKILALARPANKQAEGGFPSKVGEYLSTGNPVVTTAVGEIPLYLTDKVHAFLVKPDDNCAFAEKLIYILDNPDIAEKVGNAGKQLAKQTFDYEIVAGKMIDFIKS